MNVLAFGGGVDSTAILCGWVENRYVDVDPIDVILFADTGGEKPHTYEHIARMNDWLPRHGLPAVTVVRKGGRAETLEENCLRMNMLPSIAYGYKGCSHKYKIEPQEKYLNNHPQARAVWKSGRKVNKLIGYGFSETKRWTAARVEDEKYTYEFPLVSWQWSKPDCLAVIRRMGLEVPGKSACFFCPSTTKPEIQELHDRYPELFNRAVAMEDNAQGNLKTVKGLGRRFAWKEYKITQEVPDVSPCMVCVDGG